MEEKRIVLLGRTGAGKSSTGNNILQRHVFESSACGTSVTMKCQRGTGMRSGVRIELIDTPGLFDTGMSQEDITREIVKCIGLTAPGPHAFVLVIRIDRFTKEEQDTVEHFKLVFGEEMLNYLTVLFTRKDDLTNDGKTIDQYIQESPHALQELLHSCNNRYVAFNNHGEDEEKNHDVDNLLRCIRETVETNGGSFYTNEMYKEAERVLQLREEQIKKNNQEAVERQRREIEEECRKRMEEMEESQSEITEPMKVEISRLETLRTGGQSSAEVERLKKELQEMKTLLEDTRRQAAEAKAEVERMASERKAKCDTDARDTRQQVREEINSAEAVVMNLMKFLESDMMKPVVAAAIQGLIGVLNTGFENVQNRIREGNVTNGARNAQNPT